jgi:alkanesulfonate monooxygenase SsuD/methylene tetrahydromethanopterin reductase-like flavin-dependent oxidoreductase (luciferase family)
MKYSLHVSTRITDWKLIQELEAFGYDAAWVPDSQMIWSDCYATLALAAANTSKIRLGTGVAIPGTRIAPTSAAAISSINAIAPGRVFWGVGTGHTAMRIMGQDPMGIRDFREYLRVMRALLDGEEVDYTYNGTTAAIEWGDHGTGFRNVDDRIPIYVAANGPLALRTAGQMADGLIAVFNDKPDVLDYHMGYVNEGANKAGRALPKDFHSVSLTNAVILRPGESLTDDRVIDDASSWAIGALHFVYEIWRYKQDDAVVPDYMKGIWEEYSDYIDNLDIPAEKLHQRLHVGHCSFCPPEERRFITPAMITGAGLAGTPEEIAEQIRAAEAAGLKEISLLPGLDFARDTAREFMEKVAPLV